MHRILRKLTLGALGWGALGWGASQGAETPSPSESQVHAVTDLAYPSPAGSMVLRWTLAGWEAPWARALGSDFPASSPGKMLAAVKGGDALRAGMAWYGPSDKRHDWKWFSRRFDSDRDGRISREEWTAPSEGFARLDRDKDGAITQEDLNWSETSPWVRQNGLSLRLFRAIDKNGDGKVSEPEMDAFFRKLAKDKDHLKPDDLREAVMAAMAQENPKAKQQPRKVSDEVWLKSLIEGDLGSPLEGPALNEFAPNFTLSTQDGAKTITLSQFRKGKSVALIFGSFT